MTQKKIIKFPDFPYTRPDLTALEQEFQAALAQFKAATTAAEAQAQLLAIDAIRASIQSASSLAHIRYTINTKDAFYAAEKDWGDEHYPATEAWKTAYYQAVLDSPFRVELTEIFGQQFFRIAQLSLSSFRPEIIGFLQEENKYSSQYVQLKAGAAIELDGKTYNLSNIRTQEIAADRAKRKQAAEAKWAWYAQHEDSLNAIFSQLVDCRTQAAKTLGFETFTSLGYARMLRTDYTEEMVEHFREQIRLHIVPLASQLYDQQRQALGLETLYHYDEEFHFPDGNPSPQGDTPWILAQAQQMYDELSPETSHFFRMLQERQLMDVDAKEGKATGGYCTYVAQEGAPFIFSNFNGTSGDVDVLTHEFGHAFQVYSSRHLQPLEYNWPTYEACEIHSMSMEFLTYPWMKNIFGPDADKQIRSHLASAIQFLPYGVAVDEFQHRIYAQPDCSPQERHAIWREMEQKYLPHRHYHGHPFLEKGGFWIKQNHIFSSPFYYIDYCLAQICAFQFWEKDQQNHTEAWADYHRLCQAGGSGSFLELVALAGLQSPFEEDVVAKTAEMVGKALGR